MKEGDRRGRMCVCVCVILIFYARKLSHFCDQKYLSVCIYIDMKIIYVLSYNLFSGRLKTFIIIKKTNSKQADNLCMKSYFRLSLQLKRGFNLCNFFSTRFKIFHMVIFCFFRTVYNDLLELCIIRL